MNRSAIWTTSGVYKFLTMRKYILILCAFASLYQGCLSQQKNVGSAVLSGFSSDSIPTNNVVGFGDDSGSLSNSDVLNGATNVGGSMTGGNMIYISKINSISYVYYCVKVSQISMLVECPPITDQTQTVFQILVASFQTCLRIQTKTMQFLLQIIINKIKVE